MVFVCWRTAPARVEAKSEILYRHYFILSSALYNSYVSRSVWILGRRSILKMHWRHGYLVRQRLDVVARAERLFPFFKLLCIQLMRYLACRRGLRRWRVLGGSGPVPRLVPVFTPDERRRARDCSLQVRYTYSQSSPHPFSSRVPSHLQKCRRSRIRRRRKRKEDVEVTRQCCRSDAGRRRRKSRFYSTLLWFPPKRLISFMTSRSLIFFFDFLNFCEISCLNQFQVENIEKKL